MNKLQGNKMLKLFTSWSPNVLADKMMFEIQHCWANPFVSPVIVFPDAKTEQWYKLHLMENNAIPMNLRTQRLEYFLFNALKTSDNQQLLTPDLLRDAIIQKLISKKNDELYINKIKECDNIDKYINITDNPDDIDFVHLFDFANDLSALFIEYEATRSNIDDVLTDDDWQKELFNEITNDGITINGTEYYTCPQIAKLNKQNNQGGIRFQNLGNQNIFIFGFSGMGQTYRNLLKELGKQCDVYVFLQTVKDNIENNILLKHWGQFGQLNRDLYCAGDNTENKAATWPNHTTLGQIQNAIANDTFIDADTFQTQADESVTITYIPTKLKELEYVHSQICNLLKNNKANLRDILVLAPNIEQYKPVISAVFNQIDETDEHFPFIPFSIVDYSGKNTDVLSAMRTLYNVLRNGGLTRRTFLEFVKNPTIQSIYRFNDDDVTNIFHKWLDNLDIYRVHSQQNESEDDWENAITRMLIAKLTDENICFGSKTYQPYNDQYTESNEHNCLAAFIQICNTIKNCWTELFRNKIFLKDEDIEYMQKFLKNLFAFDKCSTKISVKEKFVFEKIYHKLDQYKESKVHMPLECVLKSLLDVASGVKFNTGTMFTRGISFTSLSSNRILPAKYVFLIGMGSTDFPGVNKLISLDRRIKQPMLGDDDVIAKNKNAFLCQLMATSDELHISFVSKDLQTGDTFYPSSVLQALMQYTNIKGKKIGIDETRHWNELYTPREWMNRNIYLQLNGLTTPEIPTDKTQPAPSVIDLPDVLSLTMIRNYIENPLKLHTYRTFGFEEPDTSFQELESIQLTSQNKRCLNKRLVQQIARNEQPDIANYQDLLPREQFGQIAFQKAKKDLSKYVSILRNYLGTNQHAVIHTNQNININMKCCNKAYNVRGEILIYAQTDSDIILYVSKGTKNDSLNKLAKMYLYDLYALVAQIAEEYKTYKACIISDSYAKAKELVVINNTTKQYAQDKINALYKSAFIDNNIIKYIPFLHSDIENVKSLDELKTKYFCNPNVHDGINYKNLLGPDTYLGFTETDFISQFQEAYKNHKQLLKDLEVKE